MARAFLIILAIFAAVGFYRTKKFMHFKESFSAASQEVLPLPPEEPELPLPVDDLSAMAGPLPLSHRVAIHDHNLFHPDRMFDEELLIPDEAPIAAVIEEPETEEELNATFELISIASYGGVRLANISVNAPEQPARRTVPSRISKLRSRSTPKQPSRPQPSRSSSNKDRGGGKVYKLGDWIKDTKFRVVQIGFSHVTLKKQGEEPLTLFLNRGDEASSERYALASKEAVSRAEAAKRKRMEAERKAKAERVKATVKPTAKKSPEQPKKEATTPPPPPPPPVVRPATPAKPSVRRTSVKAPTTPTGSTKKK